ncbi:MAG TPA: GNAT family N-acetyltransferase [Chthoniobacterales bacterium]|nr:GNAT family N-acetyltransferase [Chthoniobacterales bacterium]
MTDDGVSFLVRQARVKDAAIIARHRARMFQDMGELSAAVFEDFVEEARGWLERGLASGEYVGWLGVPRDKPEIIAGGVGVQRRQVAPHPFTDRRFETAVGLVGGVDTAAPWSRERGFAKGRQAIVINVFTEPEWRRRGLARLLMEEIVRWAGSERLDRLVLHASDEARVLYERMGFVPTNEMRYEGTFDEP